MIISGEIAGITLAQKNTGYNIELEHITTLPKNNGQRQQVLADENKPANVWIGPQIQLDSREVDFGYVLSNMIYNYDITFTNTGDEPLIIKGFSTSCGCLAIPYFDSIVMPEKKGTIRLKLYNMNTKFFT